MSPRQKAKLGNKTYYSLNVRCQKSHTSKRLTSTGQCVKCLEDLTGNKHQISIKEILENEHNWCVENFGYGY